MKIIVIILLLVILYCLGSALYFMLGRRERDLHKMAKALTWRISLSVLVFVLLIGAFYAGLIEPHPLLPPSPPVLTK